MVENDFENDIERSLLDLGYQPRKSSDYDSKTSLDQEILFRFIQETQKDNWEKLQNDLGSELEKIIVDSVYDEINSRNLLDVLRKGITIRNVHIDFAYRKPYSRKNKKRFELYQKNTFSVIRQLFFNRSTGESVDLALFLNGFLVAVAEIKDPFSKQDVFDAMKQFKNRNISDRIFQFKRELWTILHWTTILSLLQQSLEGPDTSFIPFNKYPNSQTKSYVTSYLWKEIWEKDSWLEILLNFIQIEQIKSQKYPSIVNENIIFPRYHQLRAIRNLILDTKKHGAGKKYLIEHSTGSGKSKTIAWLSYELFSLHDSEDKNVFDSIIVISDRNVIVRQLKEDIKQT